MWYSYPMPTIIPEHRQSERSQTFWQNVHKDGDGCWYWMAGKNNKGYGLFYPGVGTMRRLSHRISYEFAYGEIPANRHVLHRCDTPACVNPSHLWLGSHADNMRDKENKGRANHTSILTADNVREIRKLIAETAMTHREIAAKFGVARRTISNITNGSCWSHVV